jgi:hypothetical protein
MASMFDVIDLIELFQDALGLDWNDAGILAKVSLCEDEKAQFERLRPTERDAAVKLIHGGFLYEESIDGVWFVKLGDQPDIIFDAFRKKLAELEEST